MRWYVYQHEMYCKWIEQNYKLIKSYKKMKKLVEKKIKELDKQQSFGGDLNGN